MTPDMIAEAKLLRQLKGKKAVIKFLLKHNGELSEPLKSTLGPKRGAKPGRKNAKRNKKQASRASG